MSKEKYKYHHIGLPTTIVQKNEEYNEEWKFYGSGYFESQYGVEWLRIEKKSKLHPLIKAVPHIAFVVQDVKTAILGKNVIYGPISPAEGVTVCFIEVDGAPIEFLQFDKPESEIWPNDNKLISPVNAINNTEETVNLRYHHFGISTNLKRKGALYLEDYKLYSKNHQTNTFGIQWMKYNNDCEFPLVVQNIAHVAFQVDDLNGAIKNKKVIIEPHSPSKGILIAFIEENGALIEFLQIN